jgi:hypothetical protein
MQGILRYIAVMQLGNESTSPSATSDEYDTPWKEAVERYFPEFMAFYFPQAFAQIDWSKGYTFLDQELRAVTQDAELGKRYVDKLVQVTLHSGQEDWIYIHLEVQGTVQTGFTERVFIYNYRIYDRFRRPVASMVVLADESPSWRPSEFGFEVLGCKHTLQFPVAKLLDYAGREAELQDDPNPFALVTLAHLQTQATRHNPQARFDAKWKLVQLLYRRGWDKQRIIDLLFVIDWMMKLPEHLKHQLWQNLDNLEREGKMAYVSEFERQAIDKGMQAGVQQGMQQGECSLLARQLTRRFGALPEWAKTRLHQANTDLLETWGERVLDARSLEEVFGEIQH